MRRLPDRLLGLGLALLLVFVYVAAWRPARAWLTRHAAYPVLHAIDTPRAARFRLDPSTPHSVYVHPAPGQRGTHPDSFRAPAGILFLLPALFLIGFFPRRPFWAYLWVYHLGLGLLALGAIGLGVGWSHWGFAAHRLLEAYVVPATSLGAPAVAWFYARGPGRATEERSAAALVP